jgi:hypothetical protein
MEDLCIGKSGLDKDPDCGCPIFREAIEFFEVEMHVEPDGSGHVFLFYPEGEEVEREFKDVRDIEHLRTCAREFASEMAQQALLTGGIE